MKRTRTPSILGAIVASSALLFVASSARASSFDERSQGAILDAGIGTTPVGDFLLGELGGESTSLRTFGHGRWMVQWDAVAALKGGTLASAHPYAILLGGHAGGFVEAGRRFEPHRAWSWYAGLRLAGDFQLMVPPGVGLSDLDTVNNVDGVGDLNLSGALRALGGLSFIEGRRAFLLTLFVGDDGRLAETLLPGMEFTDVGIEARFDLASSLTLAAEAFWGRGLTTTDAHLSVSDTKSHVSTQLTLRKIFSNQMWFGATVAWADEQDAVRYTSPAASFDTTSAPSFSATLLYGLPLGSQR